MTRGDGSLCLSFMKKKKKKLQLEQDLEPDCTEQIQEKAEAALTDKKQI